MEPMKLEEVKVRTWCSRAGKWFTEVSEEHGRMKVLESVGSETDLESAHALIKSLVLMIDERNKKILEQDQKIQSFGTHQDAIRQYGPDGLVSPASQARKPIIGDDGLITGWAPLEGGTPQPDAAEVDTEADKTSG